LGYVVAQLEKKKNKLRHSPYEYNNCPMAGGEERQSRGEERRGEEGERGRDDDNLNLVQRQIILYA
jgi:hypothetical protein